MSKRKKKGKVRSRASAPAKARKVVADSKSGAGGEARLIFPQQFQAEGFTSAGISQFNDRDIPSAVRELIQNSLDAAMEIGRRPAVVRFVVENHPLESVPGLDGYKAAFESARTKHKPGDGQAADIIADIAEGLKAKTMPFLFVEDNGVGLDPKRMDALLGDGVNVKGGDEAIGSYGNGHLTVFCLSRLRYVLYGGVVASGSMTASGHAILASHTGGDGRRLSKDGFYAATLSGKEGVPNTYPRDAQIRPILKDRLETIRNDFGSGTVIAVPGFNYFGGDQPEPIAEEIRKVAALNFFPAIHEGNLEIRVSESGADSVLAQSELEGYIKQQEEERARGGMSGFPTGAKAAASYQTFLDGGEHSVAVAGGDIRLLLREGADRGVKMTRVAFCRNGMWITDQVGMLSKSQFDGKAPFDALLLADVGGCKKFHDLMARAEGRLHIDLNPRRLLKVADRESLRAAFKSVRDFLLRTVKDSENEEFEPSDFYRIETGQAVGGGKPSSVIRGEAKPVPGTFAHASAVSKKKGAGKKSEQKRRSGNTMIVRTMSKRVGANTIEIGVDFREDCDNCELQMALDNGTDPSCSSPLPKKRLYIRDAKAGGGGLNLTEAAGKRVGIMLGGAKAGDRRIVSVEFEAGQLRESGLHTVSCEFYRRAAGVRAGGEAEAR